MQLKYLPSFVKRRGRITKRQSKALEQLDNFLVTDVDDISEALKNYSSCHLEIGFGNAKHLCKEAKLNKDTLYIGSEVYLSGIGSLLASIIEEGIENIRIYDQDIRLLLDNKPKEVFDKVVIICPDPWPKEKHHKRRLINDEFISIVKRTMKNDSEIYISTDWENYAESICDSFDRSDFVIKENLKKKNDFSKFEERGIKEGRRIYEFNYIKK